ncbi:hypothetical protein ATCC90586_001342 [Pythium insidiosum]|nr:hypothetical protein ATCC90586_001342 [Pythium insidiosum]
MSHSPASPATTVGGLAAATAALQLDSAASPPRSPGLRVQIPNPFDAAAAAIDDAEMETASPMAMSQRVAAAPALPQPPRFEGKTMQDRRDFMRAYETYLGAINALQTQWGGAFAMPVGACIESRTKRMIARYEFGTGVQSVTEEQWIDFFRQASAPSYVDYAAVDEAMRRLRMDTKWPEPESRMMALQADLEETLDKFNIGELAFEHEQRRLVKYLAEALAPPSFKQAIAVRLTLHENKAYKDAVVPFCAWVTSLLREFMAWEHVAAPASASNNKNANPGRQKGSSGNPRRDGASGTSGASASDAKACYVDEGDGSKDLTVGRPVMRILGYSTAELLVRARDAQSEWELAGMSKAGAGPELEPTPLQRVCRLAATERGADSLGTEDMERHTARPTVPCMKPTTLDAVVRHLEAKRDTALRMGLSWSGQQRLRAILYVRADNFRVEFGHDPPVRVAPMQVRLKPGAVPVRAQPRRYSRNDRAFLDRHTAVLLEHGLVTLNHRSRWASAPRIVRKKEQDVDPTGVVEEVFGDLLGNGVLAWLDDILGYAEDEDKLMDLLDQVLERCERVGLKLHAKKCQFYAREVKWCGKIVSGQGVKHCPERVQGLVELQPPTTGGDLQQFLCAVNWMRQSIPEFTRVTARLYDTLGRATKAADMECFDTVRQALLTMVPLAHPKPEADVCLYTDASQDHWGAVATQLQPGGFRLYTDHRNLVYIFNPYATDGAMARYQADKLQRWALSLTSFHSAQSLLREIKMSHSPASPATTVGGLAAATAALQLDSAASPPRSPGLRVQIPNPFDAAAAAIDDAEMETASPMAMSQRVAAAPALPQPPRFEGKTMQDRRDFMRAYETYLGAINALQTQWGGAFAMPVGACIESRTKRMIARYEFGTGVQSVTEEQWIDFFRQASAPSYVDYAAVDEAMRRLRMDTKWPEPESRMMALQADLEETLDKFNIGELAFEHEQRRLVKYLAEALAPPSFKQAIAVRLTLHENKAYKDAVVPFCAWVTSLLREFMAWEHVAAPASASNNKNANPGRQKGSSGNPRRDGASGTSGASASDAKACYVDEGDGSKDLTVGRPVMRILGYSTAELLVRARDAQSEWELAGMSKAGAGPELEPTPLQRVCRLAATERGADSLGTEDMERHTARPTVPCMKPTTLDAVVRHLEAKRDTALRMGLSWSGQQRLRAILYVRADNFRVEFGHDPPVRVAPMQVRLKPGAVPVRAQPRRYSRNDRAFLDRHTAVLLEHGLVTLNHRSRWASAPRIVRKKEQDVDPTGVVEEVFGDLLGNGVLAWLDDILGYAEDEDKLMDLLDQVLERCERVGLKLHAKKCQFYAREVKWCGKIVSGQGVKHCPERVQGLVELQPPTTGGDLQQFLCAVNWMRQSIPEFTRVTARLYDTLGRATKAADMECFDTVRQALLTMVPLAHPKPEADVCLYTDASQDHWGAVATQLQPGGFRLYTDHRNLVYIFNPYATDGAMARYQADKLQRWALSLTSFQYVIEHMCEQRPGWRVSRSWNESLL